ncbi:MAG: hypothetical protein DHS20C16_21760 [Phycisphaerae bacterium]|nr:MAG: hypothetical protein DHS20C16_21760 [Phycisphaerae bacterium]
MLTTRKSHNNSKSGAPEAEAKWAALVGDRLAPMPRRRLKAKEVLHQAGTEPGGVLVRDFDGPNDLGFNQDALVDLGKGNVFRVERGCETGHEIPCSARPKLAFVVDDRWEVTVQPRQTGATLRGLFSLPEDAEICRDLESPHDDPIEDGETVNFFDGPVFITRNTCVLEIQIIVNGRPKTVNKRRLTFMEIVALAFIPVRTEPTVVYTVQYSNGPRPNPEGDLVKGQSVKLREGMVFLVTETDRS